jgi:hypothetical protein
MSKKWRDAEENRIAARLRQLLKRDGRPFVVVTDSVTGKFVQLMGSKTEPLLLDLPTAQILSDEEMKAAQELLGEPHRGKMGKRSPREFLVFHAGPFGGKLACVQAAETAVAVMATVFDATGHALKVELDEGHDGTA